MRGSAGSTLVAVPGSGVTLSVQLTRYSLSPPPSVLAVHSTIIVGLVALTVSPALSGVTVPPPSRNDRVGVNTDGGTRSTITS